MDGGSEVLAAWDSTHQKLETYAQPQQLCRPSDLLNEWDAQVLLTLSHFQAIFPDRKGSKRGAEMFCLYSVTNSHGTTRRGL